MPIGFLGGILLGLTGCFTHPQGHAVATVLTGMTLGGCYDAAKNGRLLGLLGWLFLLFFGAVTAMLAGPALTQDIRPAGQWALLGALGGAAVWWASCWGRQRSGHPIGRKPLILGLLALPFTGYAPTVAVSLMFLAFVWWVVQAFVGVLRANPARLAIEQRKREARRRL